MRRIHIPEKNIQLVDPISKQPGEFITWQRWFLMCIVDDQRMGTSPVDLARVVKLVERLDACSPGRYVDIEEQDWNRAKPIVEQPQRAIGGPLVMMQLTPYSDAFLKAQYISDEKAAKKPTKTNGAEPVASEANGKA